MPHRQRIDLRNLIFRGRVKFLSAVAICLSLIGVAQNIEKITSFVELWTPEFVKDTLNVWQDDRANSIIKSAFVDNDTGPAQIEEVFGKPLIQRKSDISETDMVEIIYKSRYGVLWLLRKSESTVAVVYLPYRFTSNIRELIKDAGLRYGLDVNELRSIYSEDNRSTRIALLPFIEQTSLLIVSSANPWKNVGGGTAYAFSSPLFECNTSELRGFSLINLGYAQDLSCNDNKIKANLLAFVNIFSVDLKTEITKDLKFYEGFQTISALSFIMMHAVFSSQEIRIKIKNSIVAQ